MKRIFSFFFLVCFSRSLTISYLFQIAKDGKESILSSIPAEFREKGSILYASLVDGKVFQSKSCSYLG